MYQIDRIAVIIKPTEKMLEWLNQQPTIGNEVLELADIQDNCTALLIPAFDEIEETVEYISEIYLDIFESELASWGIEETAWPTDRSLDVFSDWFELEFHPIVYDYGRNDVSIVPTSNKLQ